MNTLEKAEVATLIHPIAKFLKSGISIYNSGQQNKKKKKNTDNCKAFYIWRKHKNLHFETYLKEAVKSIAMK